MEMMGIKKYSFNNEEKKRVKYKNVTNILIIIKRVEKKCTRFYPQIYHFH